MTCFEASKSKEEFGAKKQKAVTDVLAKEMTSALQKKGVPSSCVQCAVRDSHHRHLIAALLGESPCKTRA